MRKPMRRCKAPGCMTLTADGYCPEHKPKQQRNVSKAWHRLYDRPEWPRLRADQLAREPFCRECAQRGERTRATEVDHIQPHRGDLRLFLDAGNLQSLCHRCHSRKTIQENPGIFSGAAHKIG